MAPEPKHESVAEHVADHISSSSHTIGDHASHLGQRVVQADEQFDVEIKARFDFAYSDLATRLCNEIGKYYGQIPEGSDE